MRLVYHFDMAMSSNGGKPRLKQRQRTRAALVDAASEAVRKGQTPTIEEAAEAAGVSRATAYRYFGSQQTLLLEVSLEQFNVDPDSKELNEGPVEARVDAAIRAMVHMAWDHETYLRTFLMHSLEHWLRTHKNGTDDYPLRKGRRLPWFERAMAPLQELKPRQKRRLRTALCMLCGVEAMIVAKDICGCTDREAEETSRWAAQAILLAAVREDSVASLQSAVNEAGAGK